MPTQILPAASLRRAKRLPAGQALLWVPNHLIWMGLWSFGRVIFSAVPNFSLPSGRDGLSGGVERVRAAPSQPMLHEISMPLLARAERLVRWTTSQFAATIITRSGALPEIRAPAVRALTFRVRDATQ